MRLYHFTSLSHLPTIVAEGIAANGELPVDATASYEKVTKAVNLTTNGSREDQAQLWAFPERCMFDKTLIRLTVELADEKLVSFRQLREKYKIPFQWLKVIPNGERKHWFYSFASIPPEKVVAVERWSQELWNYRLLSPAKLSELVESIRTEFERAFTRVIISSGHLKGARAVHWNAGVTSSWLTPHKNMDIPSI